MADWRKGRTDAAAPSSSNPSRSSDSGASGVCIMSSRWRDEQHPSFINFISSFLNANAFRLNVVQIAPDFIFNCGGVSVAFIFLTNWDCTNMDYTFDRVKKLKGQFAHFYVVVTLPTKEQNDSFVHSYFRYGMEIGKPTFMPVQDVEMGFEKIVNIAHARGGKTSLLEGTIIDPSSVISFIITTATFAVCKPQKAISKLKAEREKSVQGIDIFLKVVSSIPGDDKHDANALSQAISSLEAISKASKEYILENTDLSAEKAEKITSFFRDPKFYLSPKLS